MGMTYATVKITGRMGSQKRTLMVDTGSLYTWVDGRLLRRIGVERRGDRVFRTISGEVTRPVGEALLELLGEGATSIVVFGEEGDAQVLGTHALEGLGFEVDPTTKTLRKASTFFAYQAATLQRH